MSRRTSAGTATLTLLMGTRACKGVLMPLFVVKIYVAEECFRAVFFALGLRKS